MHQLEYRKTYQEYKAELDAELNQTAEGFVRIGYLLKVARDTDILRESGYPSVTEFAKAEYGIDKSQVSRFIHINDKFAEGGYSDRLQDQYKGFGYAKLTLMLQLPDAVNEAISPSYSKAEIQTIKDEVDAEGQVTDLERMMETVPMPTPREATGGTLNAVVYQLGEDEPELYTEVSAVKDIRELQEVMAPAGERTYSIRIPRTGRVMVILSDASNDISIVNVRTGEKETASWEDLYDAWQQLLDGDGSRQHWEKTYGKEYPKKEPEKPPVAPVQPKPEKSKKVVKAKPEKGKNRINTKSEKPSPSEESAEKPETTPETVPGEIEKVENTKCEAIQEAEEDQEAEKEPEVEKERATGPYERIIKKLKENTALQAKTVSDDLNEDQEAENEAAVEKESAAGPYEKIIKELIENTALQAKIISDDLNEGRKEIGGYRRIRAKVNNLFCDLEQLIKYIDMSTP